MPILKQNAVFETGFTGMWNGAEREAFSMKSFTAKLCVCSVQPVMHCTMGKGHQERPLQQEERPCVHQHACLCVYDVSHAHGVPLGWIKLFKLGRFSLKEKGKW